MISLLFQGQIVLFLVILFAIVLSLSFHEFGHAAMARLLGDDTAERMGRLTLNPVAHIDPMGLLLVATVGFGYARPVPFTASKLKPAWGSAAVAFAGPAMNLLIALLAANLLAWGVRSGGFAVGEGAYTMLFYLAHINILLMLFNLIPLGPLDGHYILPWLLPRDLGRRYQNLNARYGVQLFLVLILLSVAGVPIFHYLLALSDKILPWLILV